MSPYKKWIGFKTIIVKEMKRMIRLWSQTLLPPVITTTLYFMIFGHVVGNRIGAMEKFPYVEYIAPGLIMLSMINSSYSASVSAFFSAKFQRHIEEILVSPMPNSLVLLGYTFGGLLRGLIVGILVAAVAMVFTSLRIHALWVIISVGILSSAIFSLGGIINAIYAVSFDDVSYIPTFVLTPLTYLGGVFYSVNLLPHYWQYISLANPILYIVNTFRFGFLGVHDPYLIPAFVMMAIFAVFLYIFALSLLVRGVRLRS